MRILCVLGRCQYGREELGLGIEYVAFTAALERLGHEVSHFESWDRRVFPDYAALNKALLERVIQDRPDILLAVQRDCEIWTETLQAIRALRHTITIAWTTDDSWKYREVSRFIGASYDVITTTYPQAVPLYRRDGIETVFLTQWAANAEWLNEPLPAAECRYIASFVGAAYGYRRDFVQIARARGVAIECFGDGWPNGPVAAERIPEIMRESLVSVNYSGGFKPGLQRQIKARTFEVPGAGGVLLTEHAPGLKDFYEIGAEALVFDTADDLVSQVRRLQNSPTERDRIARAGFERTKRDHTYDRRFAALLEFALTTKRSGVVSAFAFESAFSSHQVSRSLAVAGKTLQLLCRAVWGKGRGDRAARRMVYEASWRLLGARTFAARGLPGRLFPQI